MIRGDDIEGRLIDFAVRVIKACEAMPDTPAARHIRSQLLRNGTSPAANYGEARGAESKRDFVHKLRIALKELNESQIWLKIVARSEFLPGERLDGLIDENEKLCRIIGASVQTAQAEQVHWQFAIRHSQSAIIFLSKGVLDKE